MINPRDALENPEMFAHLELSKSPAPLPHRPKQEEPIGIRAVSPAPEQRASLDDGDLRQLSNSSPNPPAGGSGGSEHSSDISLLHPNYPAKVTGRGGGSPPVERGSHGTPARTKFRPIRGDESPEKGAAVPKFGAWNENEEIFTVVFDKARAERYNGVVGSANSFAPPNPSYPPPSSPSDKRKTRCFPFRFW